MSKYTKLRIAAVLFGVIAIVLLGFFWINGERQLSSVAVLPAAIGVLIQYQASKEKGNKK